MTDGFIKIITPDTQASDLVVPQYLDPIVKAAFDASKNKNEVFTKNLVEGLYNNNGNYNYVVCFPKYTIAADGKEGVTWAQQWLPLPRFHLIIITSGTFTLNGKGGYKNWAWKGSVQRGQDLHSRTVKFVKPGSIGSDIESGGD
ncbi:hypothetical protein JOM56_011599 [Amanita muscaria]